jgi:hypothetical protein
MRFLILLLLTGCSTLPRSHAPTLDVPFVAQKPNNCGPAALAMLANFYGNPVTQDEIADAIYLPEVRGTLTTELAHYARQFDLWVRQYRGSSADLRQKVAADVPVIVLGKFGRSWHYFVVLGFDDFVGTVTVHSDSRPQLTMRQEEFYRFWDRADRWTMVACPPERAQWRMSADEHNDLGVFLERTGRLGAAAGHYRAATELAPQNSYFHMNLGNALLKEKLFAEAAAAFNRAVQLDPQNADALNNLAGAHLELGANLDEAIEFCNRAIALRPSHRAYYFDTLGSIYFKQQRIAEAIAAFESALAATTDRQPELRAAIRNHLVAVRAAAGGR